MRRIEAPDDYWAQVLASAFASDRLSFDQYRLVEHPYVAQWWERHWDLTEPLLDDPSLGYVRAYPVYLGESNQRQRSPEPQVNRIQTALAALHRHVSRARVHRTLTIAATDSDTPSCTVRS